MRFVDLFAGLGGFNLAAKKLGAKCVFACEIDEKLRTNYEGNFGIKPAGDIRKINPKEIPHHDLLCAGFPCQPFSKAGDQMGWKDAARGTVFFNIVEILKHCQPKYILLENVAHFVRHDKGNTYAKVKLALENLGYEVQHAQLSPHQFGVPQIRERMYMIGQLGGLRQFEWPEPQTLDEDVSIHNILDKRPKDAIGLNSQVTTCLETWQDFIQKFPKNEEMPSPIWSMEFKATYPYQQDSLYDIELKNLRKKCGIFGKKLNCHLRTDMMNLVPSYARYQEHSFPIWKKRFIKNNRELYKNNKRWIDKWIDSIVKFPPSLQKLEWNHKGGERDIWKYLIQFRASGVRVKRPTTSPSLVAMTTTQVPIIGWERRYMTIRECARLQSMDELKYFPQGSAAMTAIGNAVNVKVANLVLKNLLK
jgi:DNA (cytosine-5)-methyltransferase 1